MSRRKTERLLNLVVCLLATRRYLTAEQIRQAVPGYPDGSEAFKRMFERDKEELRELGIPLETGSEGDEETGYRIQRQAYELPEIQLTPDEAAVLGLAARVWQRASRAAAPPGRARGARPGGAGRAAREPRRGRLGRAAEVAGRGRGHRRGRLARHRTPGRHPRTRLPGPVARGTRPAPGDLRLPGHRPQRAAAPPPGALGCGEPARPVVRRGPRPRPGAGPGVPAEPDPGRRHRGPRGGHRRGPRRRRPTQAR